MAGPESQSSSAGAAIKGFNRVDEAVPWFESLSGWILLIERMFSCFSSWDETARLICGGGQFRTTTIGHLLSLVLKSLTDLSLDLPWGGWQHSVESGLRVRHQEYVPPPQTIACVRQSTDHRRTGNSLCWDNHHNHHHNRVCWSFVYVVDVEQQMVKDAALWKAISMLAPSAALADEVNKKRLFDSTFLVSSVSLTSCIISNHFLVRILWFTAERSTKAAPVIRPSS